MQDKTVKRAAVQKILAEEGIDFSQEQLQSALTIAGRFYDALGYRYCDQPTQLWYRYAELVLQNLGSQNAAAVKRLFEFYQAYNDNRNSFFVAPQVSAILDSLHDAKVAIAAVGSNLEAARRVRFCGLEKYFTHIFCPIEGIPKTQLYKNIVLLAGDQAQGCIHVGDDLILDYLAPQEYGIQAVLFDPASKYSHLNNIVRITSYSDLMEELKTTLGCEWFVTP